MNGLFLVVCEGRLPKLRRPWIRLAPCLFLLFLFLHGLGVQEQPEPVEVVVHCMLCHHRHQPGIILLAPFRPSVAGPPWLVDNRLRCAEDHRLDRQKHLQDVRVRGVPAGAGPGPEEGQAHLPVIVKVRVEPHCPAVRGDDLALGRLLRVLRRDVNVEEERAVLVGRVPGGHDAGPHDVHPRVVHGKVDAVRQSSHHGPDLLRQPRHNPRHRGRPQGLVLEDVLHL
mmetsp:Transcript_25961/g.62539  ORF Transcript_25961/g.62539 Transcript_25961/m.62539 type:complete len:226 (-) Transcript_25961:2731-3408(-)